MTDAPLLTRVISALDARKLPYALVGAAALAAHGVARSTFDAGGSQDSWDIAQLLAGDDAPAIATEVDSRIAALPADAGELWRRLRPKS